MDGISSVTLGAYIGLAKLLFATILGSLTLYVLNRHNNKQPFSLFRAINVPVNNRAPYSYILSDMVVSSILGGTVVFLLTDPTTMPQAIAAGLGMTGILSAHSADAGMPEGEKNRGEK